MISHEPAAAPDGAPAATPLLAIRNLNAGYGAIQVLRDVSFDIIEGDIMAVVGANGAGKSTLFRTISGLLTPSSGEIWFGQTNIAGLGSAEIVSLGLSQAPEGRRVFSGMTVEENLRLGAFRRRDKTRASVSAGMEQVFGNFPRLRERRKQLAGTLSGGEQQMCAIGRALMANPRLLVIDELSLGLAPIIVEELLHTLEVIHESGCTVVLVEQDVSIALSFSDRAVVMQAGQVVMSGISSELLSNSEIMKTYLGG
ncbi:MAG: amino acid/amide transporter ATP-binding protein 2, family [Paucimonas sp.]|nr:amino acid/amide transporter ATP-binding protein 2, family [Paucimonas sp.]